MGAGSGKTTRRFTEKKERQYRFPYLFLKGAALPFPLCNLGAALENTAPYSAAPPTSDVRRLKDLEPGFSCLKYQPFVYPSIPNRLDGTPLITGSTEALDFPSQIEAGPYQPSHRQ